MSTYQEEPSENIDRYTPENAIEFVRNLLGTIDLDPCADLKKRIPARFYYTKHTNGLARPWIPAQLKTVRVFANPPYGRELRQWVEKGRSELTSARLLGVRMCQAWLVPARSDPAWWHRLTEAESGITIEKAEPQGRYRFYQGDPETGAILDETPGSPKFPTNWVVLTTGDLPANTQLRRLCRTYGFNYWRLFK